MGKLIQKKRELKKVTKMEGNLTSTIGCKQKLVGYECAVTFQNDNPSTGIYNSFEEDRPYTYADETYYKHEFCGSSCHSDETTYTVEIGQDTPLFFWFCENCSQEMRKKREEANKKRACN